MPLSRRINENGFTLPELLISILILGTIIGAVAAALIAILQDTSSASGRLSDSHDEQLAAAYFASDVQSVGERDDATGNLKQSVEVAAPATSGLFPCGSAGTPDAVVRFAWNEYTVDGSGNQSETQVVVSYVVEQVGTERQLHRLVCHGGSASPVADIVVSHGLAAGSPTSPVCDTTCTGATPPHTVSLTLSFADPRDPTTATVVLTGERRPT